MTKYRVSFALKGSVVVEAENVYEAGNRIGGMTSWRTKVLDDCDSIDDSIFEGTYLTKRDTCVPYPTDDISKDIYDLFYYPLNAVRNEVAPDAVIVIEPSWEDTTFYMIANLDTRRILHYGWRKAWWFWFESEDEFNGWCENIANEVKKAVEEMT